MRVDEDWKSAQQAFAAAQTSTKQRLADSDRKLRMPRGPHAFLACDLMLHAYFLPAFPDSGTTSHLPRASTAMTQSAPASHLVACGILPVNAK